MKNRRFTVTGIAALPARAGVVYLRSDDDQLDRVMLIGRNALTSVGIGKERTVTCNYRPMRSVAGKYLIAQIIPGRPDKCGSNERQQLRQDSPERNAGSCQ